MMIRLNRFFFRLAVLSTLLTAGTPAVIYASEIPTGDLVGFWSGNGTAADSSPTGNNGSFSGSYAPGLNGQAFNLGTAKVVIPYNSAYDFQNDPGWTVGFWFNMNGITPNSSNDLFIGEDNGSGYQPKWFIDYGYTVYGPTASFVWHVNDYNTERIFLTSNTVNPVPDAWNQLTVVVDNTNSLLTFYLNGTSIGSAGLPGYELRTTAPLVFGAAEGLSFGGLMNNVAIYGRALSAAEVTDLVQATGAAPEPSTMVLLAASLGCIGVRKRLRTKSWIGVPS